MDEATITRFLESVQTGAVQWANDYVLVIGNLVQVGVIVVSVLLARMGAPKVAGFIERRRATREGAAVSRKFLNMLAALSAPVLWLVLLWLSIAIAEQAGWPKHIIRIAASLTSAWVVIRLASTLIRDPIWARFIAVTAWSMAALSTLGLFDDTVELLDSFAIVFGDTRISALIVVKGVLSLAILLWIAFAASGILESRIKRTPNLTPSVQVLFGKLIKIVLITIAFLLALDMIGIDLTAFAIFGGALGVGIGFGLQKIIANLISGLILLLDKSIAPGDVITVGDTYGWIESLGARYASVRTRDGIEHLIPNEELITTRVENWSHTDRAVRLKIPVGISYDADVRLAIKLCLESAAAVDRVLKTPETRCLLKGFGDSSVDLEIRIWIDDPANGRSNVMSEVLLHVWDRFHEHGIAIPFPQRDLHIKSSTVVPVQATPLAGG
jgi:small-conductance mechanosensitive channel